MGPSNRVVFDINLHGPSKVVVIHEHRWTKGMIGEVQSSSLSGEDWIENEMLFTWNKRDN